MFVYCYDIYGGVAYMETKVQIQKKQITATDISNMNSTILEQIDSSDMKKVECKRNCVFVLIDSVRNYISKLFSKTVIFKPINKLKSEKLS